MNVPNQAVADVPKDALQDENVLEVAIGQENFLLRIGLKGPSYPQSSGMKCARQTSLSAEQLPAKSSPIWWDPVARNPHALKGGESAEPARHRLRGPQRGLPGWVIRDVISAAKMNVNLLLVPQNMPTQILPSKPVQAERRRASMSPRPHSYMTVAEIQVPRRGKRAAYPPSKFCGGLLVLLQINVMLMLEIIFPGHVPIQTGCDLADLMGGRDGIQLKIE